MALQSGTVGDVLTFPVTQVNVDGTTTPMNYSAALTLVVEITDPYKNNLPYTATLIGQNTAQILTTAAMFPGAGTYSAQVIATFSGGVISKSAVGTIKILQSLV